MVIFIELVQYAKILGGKSQKNLVEHQIIKMIKKINSITCSFLHPIVKITHSVCYMGPYRHTIPKYGYISECLVA